MYKHSAKWKLPIIKTVGGVIRKSYAPHMKQIPQKNDQVQLSPKMANIDKNQNLR